jgi:hypothetical protein
MISWHGKHEGAASVPHTRYAQFLRDQVIAPVLAGIRKPTQAARRRHIAGSRDYDAFTDMPILVNDVGI